MTTQNPTDACCVVGRTNQLTSVQALEDSYLAASRGFTHIQSVVVIGVLRGIYPDSDAIMPTLRTRSFPQVHTGNDCRKGFELTGKTLAGLSTCPSLSDSDISTPEAPSRRLFRAFRVARRELV